MKILMIAPQPFLEPRGTPISVYQRLHGLSSLGHAIDLVTYHIGQDVDLPGVRIHRIPRLPFIKELKVGPSWAKVPLDLLLFLKSFALLMRNRYDVIHAHEEAAVFSVALSKLFRTRHLYDMHSSLPRQLVNFNFGNNRLMIGLFQLLERWIIKTCDALITIGPDLEKHAKTIKPDVVEMMIENLPLQMKNASNNLDIEAFRKKFGINDKLAIVYTGTFERYQGVGLLIESAQIVRQACSNVAFILVGGKPQQVQEMVEKAQKLQVDDCIHFTGTLPVEEAHNFLEVADILVSPRIEGTSVPLKIYTYLYSEKPIVATNLTAHSLVLNDDTAVLVEPVKEALAEGLLRVIQEPGLGKRIGAQARRLAEEKYSPTAYLAKLEKIYGTLQHAALRQEKASHSEKAAHSLDN